jgi:hypothetical protein
MTKTLRDLFKFILFVFLFSGIFGHQALAQNFTVKGNLQNGLNKSQIQGAVITLRETALATFTDNSGSFSINNVPKGKYVFNINITGFQAYQSQIKVDGDVALGTITLYPLGYEDGTNAALQKTIRATNVAELFSNRPNFIGGNAVFGIASEPKQLLGNFYLDQQWNKASILLYKEDEVIEGFYVRYNIMQHSFEIKAEDAEEISNIPGLRIRNIVWVDTKHQVPRYFINGQDLKDGGSPILGFFEVLIDGKLPLVRRTVATIKESNYNTALMIGNKDDTIMKRNIYYYIDGKNLIRIPKKKKDLFTIFGPHASEIESFVKSNNLKVFEPSSLFSVFTEFNSKFEGFDPLIPKLIH